MTIGFFPQDDDTMLSQAAVRAFSSGESAESALDTLECLSPVGSDIDLVSAVILSREAGRHNLAYPLAEAFVLATLRGQGGAAGDLRAAFGTRHNGVIYGPVEDDRQLIIVPDAGQTFICRGAMTEPPSDPLQAVAWAVGGSDVQSFDIDIRAVAWTLTSARILGMAEALLERAVAHLSQREQFGRRLGSFQTLRHRASEDWIKLEDMRAATDLAATTFDAGDTTEALALAKIAKAVASDHGPTLAENVVHAHGAMGFTWDAGLHPFLTSIRHDSVNLGTSSALFREIGTDRITQASIEDVAP